MKACPQHLPLIIMYCYWSMNPDLVKYCTPTDFNHPPPPFMYLISQHIIAVPIRYYIVFDGYLRVWSLWWVIYILYGPITVYTGHKWAHAMGDFLPSVGVPPGDKPVYRAICKWKVDEPSIIQVESGWAICKWKVDEPSII